MKPWAVVGAGAAGLAGARRLREAGVAVQVYDKGHHPGGRLASRERPEGLYDHGASQLPTPGTAPLLAQAVAAGQLQGWDSGRPHQPPVWIASISLRALAASWAEGLPIRLGCRVLELRAVDHGWRLRLDGEEWAEHPAVLLTIPAPQLPALLPALPLPGPIRAIEYSPCWTLLSPVRDGRTAPASWAWEQPADGVFDWLSREDLKPGRGGAPRLLAQAGARWSRSRLDAAPDELVAGLCAAAGRASGLSLCPEQAQMHRWLYARCLRPLGTAQTRLAPGLHYASDGCLGGGVEDALHSGIAGAEALLESR